MSKYIVDLGCVDAQGLRTELNIKGETKVVYLASFETWAFETMYEAKAAIRRFCKEDGSYGYVWRVQEVPSSQEVEYNGEEVLYWFEQTSDMMSPYASNYDEDKASKAVESLQSIYEDVRKSEDYWTSKLGIRAMYNAGIERLNASLPLVVEYIANVKVSLNEVVAKLYYNENAIGVFFEDLTEQQRQDISKAVLSIDVMLNDILKEVM